MLVQQVVVAVQRLMLLYRQTCVSPQALKEAAGSSSTPMKWSDFGFRYRQFAHWAWVANVAAIETCGHKAWYILSMSAFRRLHLDPFVSSDETSVRKQLQGKTLFVNKCVALLAMMP